MLTGFTWFAGDFASAGVDTVSYVAAVLHGWFDPLFAIIILAYPAGRLLRSRDRALALGFVAVQGAWTIVKAYALRPIAWWDCPTCIDTVDAWIAAQGLLESLGRWETLALTVLSVGVLLSVAWRWSRSSGAARRREAPVVLAGVVLVLGFTGGFLLQTILPTNARTPLGELRVVVLAILRILVSVALRSGSCETNRPGSDRRARYQDGGAADDGGTPGRIARCPERSVGECTPLGPGPARLRRCRGPGCPSTDRRP